MQDRPGCISASSSSIHLCHASPALDRLAYLTDPQQALVNLRIDDSHDLADKPARLYETRLHLLVESSVNNLK
jgi:hypothetical protein